MLFKTKRDSSFVVFFLFAFLLLTGIAIFSIITKNDYTVIWPFSGVLLTLALLFYSILKTTYFVLEEEELICKSLFFKKTIPYSEIRKVEKQVGLFAGIKFSTGWKGLIVHYYKYDELLISPEREDEFIKEIQKRKSIEKHVCSNTKI
jgi:hypothetical protein